MGFDFVEEQIRLAQERGDFDNLPGAGQPIESLEHGYDPNWWARDFMNRLRAEDNERGRSAELERKLARVWGLTTETSVRTAVANLNVEAEAELFDADEAVATWRTFRASIRHR